MSEEKERKREPRPGEGRPSKYDPKFIDSVDPYLESRKDQLVPVIREGKENICYDGKMTVLLPTLEGFALFIGVNKSTLYEWEQKHEEFSDALGRIRTEQKERLMNMGLSGHYNSTIAKLILSANHKMTERTDITSGDKELPIPLMANVLPPNNSNKEDS